MNRGNYRIFLSLALVIFCGQAFALPFLDYCDHAQGSISAGSAEMKHHHAGLMVMSIDNQEMSFSSMQSLAQSAEPDCDHLCSYCLGAGSFSAFEAYTGSFENSLLQNNSSTRYISLPSHSKNIFRPPIIA